MNKDRTIYITDWVTVAVTPLPPGWRNVCQAAAPCPSTRAPPSSSKRTAEPPKHGTSQEQTHHTYAAAASRRLTPYETRAVFADWDGVDLCPADDASNYDRTLAPGQALTDDGEVLDTA